MSERSFYGWSDHQVVIKENSKRAHVESRIAKRNNLLFNQFPHFFHTHPILAVHAPNADCLTMTEGAQILK